MKAIINILGFRCEIEVSKHDIARREIELPIPEPIIFCGYQPVLQSSPKFIILKFELHEYVDMVPIFDLNHKQSIQIYKALGYKE